MKQQTDCRCSIGRESNVHNELLGHSCAALAGLVLSSLYYSPSLAGGIWRSVDPVAAAIRPSMQKGLGEMIRTLVLTLVIARLLGC